MADAINTSHSQLFRTVVGISEIVVRIKTTALKPTTVTELQ